MTITLRVTLEAPTASPAPDPPVRLGLLAIIIAIAALAWTFPRLPHPSDMHPDLRTHILTERALALAAHAALLTAGILMLRRPRRAVPALILVIILSLARSTIVVGFLLPPVPDNLTAAGRAGRHFGRLAGLILPLLFYAYLTHRARRAHRPST